jgi:phosphoglycolate phosphatase
MAEVWVQVLSRLPDISRPPVGLEEIRGNMGLLLDEIEARMFPDQSKAERRAVVDEFCAMEEEFLAMCGGVLFPGTEKILAALAETYRLFIVSNCQDGYIECFYRGNGLERFFSGHECAGRTGLPKSGNIKLVAERYGLKSPVYIGDTLLDCSSAQEAGVPFLHAAYGFGQVPGAPYVTAFDQIPAALEAMSPP